MPSIRDSVQHNAARIAQGEPLVEVPSKDGPASNNPTGPIVSPSALPVTGLPVRGTYPPNLTLHTDFQNNTQGFRSGPNMRSAMFPPAQTSSSSIVTKVLSGAASVAASLIIKVNNMLSPNQSVLNLLQGVGIGISVDAGGNVTFSNTSTSVSDGITHGTLPWEGDPSLVTLVDDFMGNTNGTFGNSIPTSSIGQLGWKLSGTTGTHGGFIGGTPLNIGALGWDNSGTATNNGLLTLGVAQGTDDGTASMHDGSWALFENAGWKMTYVFKVEASWIPGSTATSTAQKSIYVGLVGPSTLNQASASYSRPAIFMGCRYDTDPGVAFVVTSVNNASGGHTVYNGTFTNGGTNNFNGQKFTVAGFVGSNNNGTFTCVASTAIALTLNNAAGTTETKTVTATTPVLSDTKWTLEVVANQEYPTAGQTVRNNTQGTTLVTTQTPTVGTWMRLDIISNSAGSITMTLNGTDTLTASVPVYTLTASASEALNGNLTNNVINITDGSLNPVPLGPWGPGSSITITGFTSTQAYFNATWIVSRNNAGASSTNIFINNTHANIGGGSTTTGTISGYPIVTPAVLYGNDSVVSPPASSLLFYIDYFSFAANPNLGPNAPGTVVATNSRYF